MPISLSLSLSQTHTHTHTHTHTQRCACTYTHTRTHTCTHTHTPRYTRVHTHARTHARTHTHTQILTVERLCSLALEKPQRFGCHSVPCRRHVVFVSVGQELLETLLHLDKMKRPIRKELQVLYILPFINTTKLYTSTFCP